MKKTFAIFALCLLVLAGGVIAAVTTLHDDRDQVVVTANDLAGDRAAAEGFTAQQSLRRGEHLQWDLNIDLGQPENTQTEFTYRKEDMGYPYQDIPEPIWITSVSGYSSTASLDYLSEEYQAMAQDVFSRTPEGEARTETILLSDYWDCYPLSVSFGFDRDNTAPEEDQAIQDAFNEFFRFPVIPGNTIELTIDLTPGAEWQVTTQPANTAMDFHMVSAMTETALFFSFQPASWPFPSFENVPGGYGLYRLDLTEGRPDPDSLTCVHPLPEGTFALDLALTPDGSHLLLTTGNRDGYTCTVLDPQTMEETQTFPIPMDDPVITTASTLDKEGNRSSYPYYYFEVFGSVIGEDFFLLLGYDDIHLFLLEDGAYVHQFTASTQEYYIQTIRPGCLGVWNGETLALASHSNEPGLALWVLDSQGALLYHGLYATSLEADAAVDESDLDSWQDQLFLVEGRELTLRWGG